jgi:hypothetical protein
MYTLFGGVTISEKVYHFRLGKNDFEVEEILEKKSGSERSNFIRTALQFYIEYGEQMKELMSDVKEIKAFMTDGAIVEKPKEVQQNKEEEKIQDNLVEGIMDILNM